ncbi:hypothetical protein [Microbacterium sp. RURRCA19A]|uniref:hypothetical protein n=1 Tax=Microbacterium sp. RURRCA19A TaxID=1907391 RepID=UPI000955391D|nr:hypothetical protein [Microbacterium sp. RURRCA19A]SIS10710.1 hypothetical protein SAMN05880568_2811 [Microbacterium sp. RURRCA19A]
MEQLAERGMQTLSAFARDLKKLAFAYDNDPDARRVLDWLRPQNAQLHRFEAPRSASARFA